MRVKNKVFVVTGGGNGVGRELVLQLLLRGARVAAVDIDRGALKETAACAQGSKERLSLHTLNIADRKAVEAFPEQVNLAHGQVDGIINNAGVIHSFTDVGDMAYDSIARVMDINFGGTLYMVKAFLPHLAIRPEACITNISSMGAFFPVPGQAIYGASKAGVKLLTESLRFELGKSNISVMAVFPGGISSNILDNSGVKASARMERLRKIFKLLTPNKAARMIIRGIEKNKHRLTIGIDSTLTDFFAE